MCLKGKVVFFATTNCHKFNEACQVFAEYGVAVAMLKIGAIEIQHDNPEEIAKFSVREAVDKSGLPLFVEDAGLSIEALKGFPGPYSSYVHQTLGTKGVLKLIEGYTKRNAHFYSVIAFSSPERASPKCFQGKIEGKISSDERGNQGFGFDPIFEPKGGSRKTFAEMTTIEKNKLSHRAQALRKFVTWYKST
ncbi:MAG: XTP/dITP diphosphatase [Candidatus Bathyarchaeota archaeon]|jgi:XTP/dITP diphosphohydrolase